MIHGVGMVLVLGGAVALVIAAWGVLILPDALSRQHAATKAGTLALALICLGVALLVGEGQWTWRLLLIVVFLLTTLPVAAHLLARAAVQEADLERLIEAAPRIDVDTEGRPT
ncbi:MAG: monovalent cation/H(+) antiporter subunit G [Gammaproteobacteria bacterium]|nr:monovalent cation/H(+) antiporter subunit G [Gammaproteobacteria bacterium]